MQSEMLDVYRFEKKRLAMSLTAPVRRFQNIRRKPASAAKNDATGINESGPMYTRYLLKVSYETARHAASSPPGVPCRYRTAMHTGAKMSPSYRRVVNLLATTWLIAPRTRSGNDVRDESRMRRVS